MNRIEAGLLDTNVLLYSISRDPAEAEKRERAIALLESEGAAVSTQVLQEFYVQATRAGRADALPHEIAAGLVLSWARLPAQAVTLAVVADALRIRAAAKISYWDAAIVAAARALGLTRVYSEDLQTGATIAGVRVVNPFL